MADTGSGGDNQKIEKLIEDQNKILTDLVTELQTMNTNLTTQNTAFDTIHQDLDKVREQIWVNNKLVASEMLRNPSYKDKHIRAIGNKYEMNLDSELPPTSGK